MGDQRVLHHDDGSRADHHEPVEGVVLQHVVCLFEAEVVAQKGSAIELSPRNRTQSQYFRVFSQREHTALGVLIARQRGPMSLIIGTVDLAIGAGHGVEVADNNVRFRGFRLVD